MVVYGLFFVEDDVHDELVCVFSTREGAEAHREVWCRWPSGDKETSQFYKDHSEVREIIVRE